MTSSLLNLVFPTRFFSLSLFLLLDEPQPRKTNGDDHHGDENGVLHHSAVDLNQKRFMLYCVLLYVVAAVLERTMARATIAYLEQRYTALESEIADALRQSPTDDLMIADLKYRKLIIADEIQHNRRFVERFSQD